jgi:uncharacterized lipoprotein YmbA
MKRKKETILLVLAIAALSAYLVYQKMEKPRYNLPEFPKIDKDMVTGITIQKGDSVLTLQRDGDRWRILPEGYTADASAVDRMLEIIESLRLTAMASASENYSRYDLNDAERIQVAAFEGEDLLVSVSVGKAAPSHRHTFVKLTDDKRIYHAEKNFRSHFDKDVSALRDRQVLKIDEQVSEIILTTGEQSLHILRAKAPVEVSPDQGQTEGKGEDLPEGAPGWETLEGKPVLEKEVDAIVKTLSNMKCEDYLEGEKEDLGEPSYSVSLKGSRSYEFSLYDARDNKFAATSSENDYPFLISEWKAKRIKKDLSDLVEKKE